MLRFSRVLRRPTSPWFWAMWVPIVTAATLAILIFWPWWSYRWEFGEYRGSPILTIERKPEWMPGRNYNMRQFDRFSFSTPKVTVWFSRADRDPGWPPAIAYDEGYAECAFGRLSAGVFWEF